MVIVTAALQEGRQRFRQQLRLGHRRHRLQLAQRLVETAAADPADAKIRRQRFGKAGAKQHPAIAIERLHRRRQRATELDLGIQPVFNQRHLMIVHQPRQPLFAASGIVQPSGFCTVGMAITAFSRFSFSSSSSASSDSPSCGSVGISSAFSPRLASSGSR